MAHFTLATFAKCSWSVHDALSNPARRRTLSCTFSYRRMAKVHERCQLQYPEDTSSLKQVKLHRTWHYPAHNPVQNGDLPRTDLFPSLPGKWGVFSLYQSCQNARKNIRIHARNYVRLIREDGLHPKEVFDFSIFFQTLQSLSGCHLSDSADRRWHLQATIGHPHRRHPITSSNLAD